MSEAQIPIYNDMMLPTLQALDALGGSATKDEIEERTIKLMKLTDDQLAVEFPPDAKQSGSKVLHRLAWARTYLKKLDAISNSARGVWRLEPSGQTYLTMDAETATEQLREGDARVRREYGLERRRQLAESASEATEPTPVEGTAELTLEEYESQEAGLEPQGSWSDLLLDHLKKMPPDGFERLAMQLLREAGFRNVEVTRKSADGGIDGVGVYKVSLVSFRTVFQCKRYNGTVSSPQVRDFRGAMSSGDRGLLITTGTFTQDAKKEATRPGAAPIDLIDGEELCDLLRTYEVGVLTVVRSVEDIEVDKSYFDSI